MAVTSADLLDYLYYRCLPGIYQEEDAKMGKPLYRYLQSIILGGYDLAIQDIDNIIKLVDPETCPEQFFPILYESFGLEYYPNISVDYHRKLLMNYGELSKRRGTYSCIKFLVRVLTSMDVKLHYFRGEYGGSNGRFLKVSIQAITIKDMITMDNSIFVVQSFLGLFIPYYITVIVEGEIAAQKVSNSIYRCNLVSSSNSYTIGM